MLISDDRSGNIRRGSRHNTLNNGYNNKAAKLITYQHEEEKENEQPPTPNSWLPGGILTKLKHYPIFIKY